MSNEIQKPMFASASSQSGNNGQNDDFDLNEIFADYFISEFEDPMNAYTSSMANYGGAAAAVAMAQQPNAAQNVTQTNAQNAQTAVQNAAAQLHAAAQSAAAAAGGSIEQLPTGGIRTAFHAAVAQPLQHYNHGAPPQKKTKTEFEAAAQSTLAPGQGPAPAASMPALAPIPAPAPATIAAPAPGGITSRLGVPFPMANIPGMSGGIHHQVFAQPNQQFQQQQQQQAVAQSVNGVTLPVGVGIRLGGTGGVAPTTAQTASRAGVAGYNIWGNQQQAGMSDQAIAERRQRNREHAKRSRVRKKFMLESLQEQVMSLQRENQNLRTLVQDNIPEHAQKIISECCNTSPLFADSTPSTDGKERPSAALVRSDFSLMESLSSGQQNFVLSDPRLPDNPIVFATPGFYKLTGYTQEQVLGRNCRFLQGPGTNPKAVDIIRKAVATGSDCTTCILNYKADGTPFWNQFFVAALRDSDNCIVNYVGVQTEIEPEAGANALEDRVNAVLPLQNKDDDPNENYDNAEGGGSGGNDVTVSNPSQS